MNTKTKAVTGEGTASRGELDRREQNHWNDCCAQFCGEIQQLALKHRTTWQQIFRLWRRYAKACESADQSAVMFEFEQTLRVNVACGGRTIWNSDGVDGPALICAPTFEDIQVMAGFPVDREGFAVFAEEEDKVTSDEDYANKSGTPKDDDESDDDEDGPELRDDLREDGRSDGQGESYAERNA